MIVVDTSALIAILTEEPEADAFRAVLYRSSASSIASVTLVEATQVASRDANNDPSASIDRILSSLEIDVVPVDRTIANLARQAFLAFGKGRHKAALNICDCFVYALAKSLDAPILFKGGDFSLTDAKIA